MVSQAVGRWRKVGRSVGQDIEAAGGSLSLRRRRSVGGREPSNPHLLASLVFFQQTRREECREGEEEEECDEEASRREEADRGEARQERRFFAPVIFNFKCNRRKTAKVRRNRRSATRFSRASSSVAVVGWLASWLKTATEEEEEMQARRALLSLPPQRASIDHRHTHTSTH